MDGKTYISLASITNLEGKKMVKLIYILMPIIKFISFNFFSVCDYGCSFYTSLIHQDSRSFHNEIQEEWRVKVAKNATNVTFVL